MTPPLLVPSPVAIPTPSGPVSGLWLVPDSSVGALVLGHGAGAGMHHQFMTDLAQALARVGVATLRYQFPSRETGKSRPDTPAVATATVAAAVAVARSGQPKLPWFAGGKSFGGRMSSTAAAEGLLAGVRGLVFYGFPLHPAGRPAITRADHLARVGLPMLFLQGTHDDLAEIDLIRQVAAGLGPRATLHEIAGADHAFRVPTRTGRTAGDVIDELARVTAVWMAMRLLSAA